MPLVQLDGGDPSGEPVQVNMEYVVHPVPRDADLPQSHIDCTKIHDDSGPSEYVAHLYVHEGPPEDRMTTVREVRVEAALAVIKGFDIFERSNRELAEKVVDALFIPDPVTDNLIVPSQNFPWRPLVTDGRDHQ